MNQRDNHELLLRKMNAAFSDYYREAEKLSELLAEPRNLSSWSSYHALLKQRTAEIVAYESYSRIRGEVFALIAPPLPEHRPQSTVN